MKIGRVLKHLRLIKGATQDEVAAMLNITRTSYSKWENDRVDLTISQASKVAAAYGLKLSFLVSIFETGFIIAPDVLANYIHASKFYDPLRFQTKSPETH